MAVHSNIYFCSRDSSEDELPEPKKKKKRFWRLLPCRKRKEPPDTDSDESDETGPAEISLEAEVLSEKYSESETEDSDYYSSGSTTDYSYSYQNDKDTTALPERISRESFVDIERQNRLDYASMQSFGVADPLTDDSTEEEVILKTDRYLPMSLHSISSSSVGSLNPQQRCYKPCTRSDPICRRESYSEETNTLPSANDGAEDKVIMKTNNFIPSSLYSLSSSSVTPLKTDQRCYKLCTKDNPICRRGSVSEETDSIPPTNGRAEEKLVMKMDKSSPAFLHSVSSGSVSLLKPQQSCREMCTRSNPICRRVSFIGVSRQNKKQYSTVSQCTSREEETSLLLGESNSSQSSESVSEEEELFSKCKSECYSSSDIKLNLNSESDPVVPLLDLSVLDKASTSIYSDNRLTNIHVHLGLKYEVITETSTTSSTSTISNASTAKNKNAVMDVPMSSSGSSGCGQQEQSNRPNRTHRSISARDKPIFEDSKGYMHSAIHKHKVREYYKNINSKFADNPSIAKTPGRFVQIISKLFYKVSKILLLFSNMC